MKRVRGVDDIAPPAAAAGGGGGGGAARQTQGNSGNSVGAPASTPAPSGVSGAGAPGPGSNLEYLPGSGIAVVSGQQQQATVRTVPARDMSGSIQLQQQPQQQQQQYPGAIVVPTAAASSVKGSVGNLSASSCAAASNLSSLHSSGLGTGNHSLGPQAVVATQAQAHPQQPSAIRHKMVQAPAAPVSNMSGSGTNSQQFQRLKVEDALSYLDQVKFKFNDQPQVYNDFLDIMKEFKSQSIDTPGVIQRVSNLFKGHPELIVGFNTFLPPGYKIEVQANDQGYAYQVSVSMPSPTATHTATLSQHHCTVNVGSPPIATPPTQPAKVQPVVQIMQGSGSLHHSVSNNISNNTVTIHGPSSPVSAYNNSHVTTAQAQAVSQALSQAQDGVPSTGQTQQNQPVEFNHAISYVNKIKERFRGQPEKYKRFLEILHTYQKEQRVLKEASLGVAGSGGAVSGSGKPLTEAEVYSQVAKLFENQEDLLLEFGQFLPDATNQQGALSNKMGAVNDHSAIVKKPIGLKAQYNNTGVLPREHRDSTGPGGMDRDGRDHRDRDRERERAGARDMGNAGQKFGHSQGQLKRSPSFPTSMPTGNSHVPHGPPPPKKHKVASARDISVAEVGKHGTLNDYAFFDKVRKALRSQEVYENFLRCLVLFNQEIISKTELVQLVQPFLGRFPELFRWFKDFLGHSTDSQNSQVQSCTSQNLTTSSTGSLGVPSIGVEALPNNVVRSHQDRPQGDLAMEIDYSTCKRLGASYCALPKSYVQPKCTGRTQLCKEVLNDTWVSFPTWSEDSTFVTSRKTQFEEFIYRCEDERFELDGVIETNAATIRVLEGVHKKMSRMSQDELQKFKLDDCLGGYSPTIHQRALKRIYGDKAADIIEGLKKNPMVAVPIVLKRLKAKEEEWREAQKGFNKIWREQNEKYYLKSLDHQGINFKQTDVKALRSKSLFNEIEVIYDERHEQADETGENQVSGGPHLILSYKDKTVLDDAANLLIHHVKRQTAIHKEDKQKIKVVLKHFIPDLFFHPRQELSDDEQDDENDKDETNLASCGNSTQTGTTTTSGAPGIGAQGNSKSKTPSSPAPSSVQIKLESDAKAPLHALSSDPEEAYSHFIVGNHWYLFLRLHQVLCERLSKMYDRAMILAHEESQYKQQRAEATSVALRLKPKSDIEIEDYYPAFLDMVKNVLDGNMDGNAYEDQLREMFGIHAFIAFTLDKVVSYAVRQLQHLVTDSTCLTCTEMFQREQRQSKESTGAGGLCTTAYLRLAAEQAYQRRAEKVMAEENCFKVYIYKKSGNMTIELLDTDNDGSNEGNGRDRDRESVSNTEKWSSYVERYTAGGNICGGNGNATATNVTAAVAAAAATTTTTTTTTTGQSSPKDVPSENEPPANHPVSSDQAAKGGRGRKRKNTDINKKIDGNGWSKLGKVLAGRKRSFLSRNIESYHRHMARKMRPTNDLNDDHDGKEGDEDDTATSENVECLFDILQKCRVVFIVNSEDSLYKKDCLTHAKQSHPESTRRRFGKFQRWHRDWSGKNVSETQQRQCQDWLLGRCENLVPHRTRLLQDNDSSRTPYRQYNRFSVERVQPENQQQQQSHQSHQESAIKTKD